MSLQVYRKKRDFGVTPEPRGGTARAQGGRYVIQKHAARRLHYDFRLELDGVMKSWAVTRGPSLVPGEKRLAIHVEDHPIEYNTFEGTIPEGQYGGGAVMIWDRGRWYPEGDPHKDYRKGRLDFRLDGEKLKGRWHLVRMRKGPKDKQDPWLLIKSDDAAARGARDPDVLEETPLSVVSGRSIEEIAAGRGGKRVWQSSRGGSGKASSKSAEKIAPPARRQDAAVKPRGAKRASAAAKKKSTRKKSTMKSKAAKVKPAGAPLPDFVPPQLASLREEAPRAAGWVHEVKFDGYRIQARLDHGEVRLLTRNGLDWTGKFPNVAAAIAELPAETALLDGELVVEDESGVSRFSALQADLKAGRRDRFVYHVFDLLHLDGADLVPLPLVERKAALTRLLAHAEQAGPIRPSAHFEGEGALVLRQACHLQLEGIVSKRAQSPYVSGRSESWIKAKCANQQELVVIGYAPSTVSRDAIGALIVGYYEEGRLRYGGRVGTGYSQAMARDLWRRLHPLMTKRPPIDPPPPQERRRRDVVWVQPQVVIEANFRDWTADRLVRQAAFKGVREDKPAQEVARETPAMAAKASVAKKTSKSPAPPRRKAPASGVGTPTNTVTNTVTRKGRAGAHEVRLTHPDRVYWVDVGVTKQDLADYYAAVWDWMAPQVVGRPLALVRCPEGTKGQCFFQKHASAGLSKKTLRSVTDSKGRQVIGIEDLDGLFSLVQAGVLEIHVRGAMLASLDVCDRIVFDLDPGEGADWSAMVSAARDVRARLAALGLESFVKLSGGKGLHVVLPVEGTDWDSAKSFAQGIALAMAAGDPERYLAKITKSLRKGRIFVDYLRNSLEQTSIAAYSTRARAGAPVSVPVSWEELGRTTSAHQYTVRDLMQRLSRLKQDPWRDIGRIKQKLPQARSAGG
jgi:bifunctional non-homologous end joining protein LigD